MIVEHLASSYRQDLEQEVDRFLELVAEPEDTLRRVFQLLLMEEKSCTGWSIFLATRMSLSLLTIT